jgi:transcriptional regulator with XRE-family HTH domain
MTGIHSKPYSMIVDALIAARKAAPLTQVELAKIWGKKQPTITKIEQCERRIDMAEFLELCIILNANPTDILREAHLEMKRSMLSK